MLDDDDAALWTALAAADDDLLTAITESLDLDTGLARVLKDVDSFWPPPAGTPGPAQPEDPFRIRWATVIRNANNSDPALGDLYLRIRRAADAARGKHMAATEASRTARTAEDSFRRARGRRWRARRHAVQAARAARVARAEASQAAAARDRLVEAYISKFRRDSLLVDPATSPDVVASALRHHLLEPLPVGRLP